MTSFISAPLSCHHENDDCCLVMVATPHIPSLIECNKDCDSYLYKEPVDPSRVLQQHSVLVQTLKSMNVHVLDIAPLVCDLPGEELATSSLGNFTFTRDPVLCTSKGVVLGKFKEDVRKKETEILHSLLPRYGIPITARIDGDRSCIEGGDFIPAGDISFIGIGNRTNMEGVWEMMERDLFGTPKVTVVLHPCDGNMHAIHLDCYMGLVGKTTAILWEEAANAIMVEEYIQDSKTRQYSLSLANVPLGDYMTRHGWTVIKIPMISQQKYGCNLLYIGNNHVLTQESFVSEELSRMGYHVTHLEFGEIHKMYGGIRCATQTLLRK